LDVRDDLAWVKIGIDILLGPWVPALTVLVVGAGQLA
jgi:hypothetical protein